MIASIISVLATAVFDALWVFEQLGHLPSRLRVTQLLSNAAGIMLVFDLLAALAAFNDGLQRFVEYRANQILEQSHIRPPGSSDNP